MPEDNNAAHAGVAAGRREQPFLYSWNRRIRHLHGVSLRNLNISPSASRTRGKTIAEDDYDLKTPAKLLAKDERTSLHQSKSFDDFSKADRVPFVKQPGVVLGQPKLASKRPGKPRRRSTMHWGASNPKERQRKLEDVALNRLVDTWFSLHHSEFDEPVYISEVMERSMNPSFSFFDLDGIAARVTRDDEFEIKIWTRNCQTDAYRLLVALSVNLRSLQFIGKSMEDFHHPLPQNCVLFHLSDGIYTSFTDLPAAEISEPQLRSAQRNIPAVSTSSYDALMKLANLDECIQDALQSRRKLEADISALLAKKAAEHHSPEQVEVDRETLQSTKHAHNVERQKLEQLKKKKVELERSRDQRKQALAEADRVREASLDIPVDCQKKIETTRTSIEKISELSAGQVRRVFEELLRIYPIEPIKNRTLQFTIRHIHLPNSVFDDTNRDEIAAALGYTGQLVHRLSLYLSIPLPYPIEANGSSSFIEDPISLSLAQRKFPLHPTNVNYKFEYAVFLLNKDIEFLMNRSGLRVLDIRHTLPNLKYLIYVVTASPGDLPARKAGGIRGLWGGPITPSLSRRGSEDSVLSHASTEHINGSIVAISGKEKGGNVPEPFVASGRVKGLPYRRSLLREAG